VASRWWIYQRERFPVLAHGPLIAAFSFSAVSVSALLRGRMELPEARSLLVAGVSTFVFFLELRVADEFKDSGEDARYRPYRPVPRGLVTLKELGMVGAAGMLIQLGLALWLDPTLVLLLVPTWLYLGLMSKEFFAPEWLGTRPITYLWTHMLIMPLIVLYATACEWLVAGVAPPASLPWFLAVGFFNGIVIEVGRKIRGPEDEEPGVTTYTMLWGPGKAVSALLGAMVLAAAAAVPAARRIGVAEPAAGLMVVLLGTGSILGWRFLRLPGTHRAKMVEVMSGVWTLLLYLCLGALPWLARW
jgi:4-hydroxybenzoate polyprenyltransferase